MNIIHIPLDILKAIYAVRPESTQTVEVPEGGAGKPNQPRYGHRIYIGVEKVPKSVYRGAAGTYIAVRSHSKGEVYAD